MSFTSLLRFSCLSAVGHLPKFVIVSKESTMDYAITGFVGILLFAYLIYALARPERF